METFYLISRVSMNIFHSSCLWVVRMFPIKELCAFSPFFNTAGVATQFQAFSNAIFGLDVYRFIFSIYKCIFFLKTVSDYFILFSFVRWILTEFFSFTFRSCDLDTSSVIGPSIVGHSDVRCRSSTREHCRKEASSSLSQGSSSTREGDNIIQYWKKVLRDGHHMCTWLLILYKCTYYRTTISLSYFGSRGVISSYIPDILIILLLNFFLVFYSYIIQVGTYLKVSNFLLSL